MSLHRVREHLKPLVPPRVRRRVNRVAFAVNVTARHARAAYRRSGGGQAAARASAR